MRNLLFSLVTVAALVSFGAPASAEVCLGRPGSVLVFPLFDSSDAANTIITVTNTNEDRIVCSPTDLRGGDVEIVYFYIDGETWRCTDVTEPLTPGDTISVLTNRHNPNMERGFLVVQARDPETFLPVDFDFLIGSAIVVNTDFDFSWSYLPYSFEAVFTNPVERDRCGRTLIEDDGCVKFGNPDEEGPGTTYYDRFPDTLLIDRFFGEGGDDGAPAFTFTNRLVLLSTDPGFEDPEETRISIVGFNNNERRFSRSFDFICFLESTLADITLGTSQESLDVNSDEDELGGVNTGWMRIRANSEDVGILGVFVDMSNGGGAVFSAGNTIQFTFDDDDARLRGKNVKICCGFPF